MPIAVNSYLSQNGREFRPVPARALVGAPPTPGELEVTTGHVSQPPRQLALWPQAFPRLVSRPSNTRVSSMALRCNRKSSSIRPTPVRHYRQSTPLHEPGKHRTSNIQHPTSNGWPTDRTTFVSRLKGGSVSVLRMSLHTGPARSSPTPPSRLSVWLLGHRTTTRLAFFLQIGCRGLTSVFNLLWIQLLLRAMGKDLNGLFLNFQSIASLGGLGDLGMGGMVNIQTSRMLGQGKERELRGFLAAARGFFGVVTLLAVGVFLIVSPSLLRWQKFDTVPTVGPLVSLCVIGALAVGMVILNSYITNLNYGCGNILWPVIPGFILLQFSLLVHWLLARKGLPLWMQFTPYLGAAVITHALNWWWLRVSHPALGGLRPVTFEWRQSLSLAGKSFWIYLYSVAMGIVGTVSALLITAGFGPGVLPNYRYNGKLCELTMFAVVSAGSVSLPKITQWLASPEPGVHKRALREIERLNQFQTLLGCAGALAYLACNDWFMRFWLGESLRAPLSWQAAFAANLAVTCAGQLGYELTPRCCEQGMRVGGVTAALMALLNLGLSLIAVKLGSLFGIALAGVISQSAVVLGLGWYSCRQIKIPWWRLTLRNWLLALAVTALGVAIHILLPIHSALTGGVTAGICLAAILLVAFILGIRMKDVREEIVIVRGILGNK
jgi:O-antigen/teichoic acid export membrane protein